MRCTRTPCRAITSTSPCPQAWPPSASRRSRPAAPWRSGVTVRVTGRDRANGGSLARAAALAGLAVDESALAAYRAQTAWDRALRPAGGRGRSSASATGPLGPVRRRPLRRRTRVTMGVQRPTARLWRGGPVRSGERRNPWAGGLVAGENQRGVGDGREALHGTERASEARDDRAIRRGSARRFQPGSPRGRGGRREGRTAKPRAAREVRNGSSGATVGRACVGTAGALAEAALPVPRTHATVCRAGSEAVPQPSPVLSQSPSFDQRRRPAVFRTARPIAFACPTSTTSRLPRVTPV